MYEFEEILKELLKWQFNNPKNRSLSETEWAYLLQAALKRVIK